LPDVDQSLKLADHFLNRSYYVTAAFAAAFRLLIGTARNIPWRWSSIQEAALTKTSNVTAPARTIS
jgi:hypothetical protein